MTPVLQLKQIASMALGPTSTFLRSRSPRLYVVDGDNEPLRRAQNPTYGAAESGEIHTGIQRERRAPVPQKVILSLAFLSIFSLLAIFYLVQNAAEERGQRREKEEQKRQEREEEARKRASIAWIGLELGHCLRYKLKEYTARLSHVPLGLDGIKECWNKSIEIHGRQWFPSQCEDQSHCGRITGHWQVDFDEPSCTPWWGYSTDKGCAESGLRRYEAKLENLQDITDWPNVCRTAPTSIGGTWYDGPISCDHRKNDIWGTWLIKDDTCH